MTIDIEPFETITGWASDGTMTAELMEHPEYIAMHKTAAVLFKNPGGNLNKSISKSLNIEMDGKNEIVLSIWSQKKSSNWYVSTSDFRYLIEFADGVVFYLPIYEGFNQVSFYVPGISTVERIKITALHNDADCLVLSACVGVIDEYPLDVMAGVRSEIQRQVNAETGPGMLLGTISASAGDTSLNAPETDFLERMAAVFITDGVNSETHAIDRTDKGQYTFATTYDGQELLHDYVDASLYLYFPVEFGRAEQDAIFPSINIWKMAPSPVQRSSDIDEVYDSARPDGTWQNRRVPLNLVYHLLIDCEARHSKIQAIMNRAVRRFLGSNEVWINGRKHGFQFEIEPVEIEPDQSIEQFAKVQYTIDIEVQEEREVRTELTGVALTEFSTSPLKELP